jgi:hypothetical protein
LLRLVKVNFAQGVNANPVPWVCAILIALAALMLIEALRVFLRGAHPPPTSQPMPVPA